MPNLTPSFPLEGGYIRVHESPFRLSTSSADIYKFTETSGSFSEESRGAAIHLRGRYSLDGIHPDFAEISYITHIPCTHSFGIHSKPSQVRTGALTVIRLPRFLIDSTTMIIALPQSKVKISRLSQLDNLLISLAQ